MTSTPEADPTSETAEAPESTPETAPMREPIDEQAARPLALAALHEITPATTVGEPRDSAVDADGVLTIRFENRMPGYPGWYWTVSLAQVEGAAPTVLEAELMPGDGALTAPDWLPWAERLAEYQAAQAALAAEGLETDDLDAVDFDNDGSPILHSGDVDGVDIDELSDDAVDAIDEPIIEDDSEVDDDDDDDESDDDESDDDEESDDEDDEESDGSADEESDEDEDDDSDDDVDEDPSS
jgi:hypothetical protein